ncbi:hypothetical protein [Mycobacteroides abscessus]|uniref:hypothetical protein n=1 Tax=Mycobacteroides abscessus TaxID=36809 RepID=UPI0012FF0980|nr:hypothetical protein [Mycobacteroides abscessus]
MTEFPIGMVRQRPDGMNTAFRTEVGWHYGLPAMNNAGDDADSWPVVFDPSNPQHPIGTVVRRPDGHWLAYRFEDDDGTRWGYTCITASLTTQPKWKDADSWPVIYTPINSLSISLES